jgi:hypothetical protein
MCDLGARCDSWERSQAKDKALKVAQKNQKRANKDLDKASKASAKASGRLTKVTNDQSELLQGTCACDACKCQCFASARDSCMAVRGLPGSSCQGQRPGAFVPQKCLLPPAGTSQNSPTNTALVNAADT